jgi:hypothetical protein
LFGFFLSKRGGFLSGSSIDMSDTKIVLPKMYFLPFDKIKAVKVNYDKNCHYYCQNCHHYYCQLGQKQYSPLAKFSLSMLLRLLQLCLMIFSVKLVEFFRKMIPKHVESKNFAAAMQKMMINDESLCCKYYFLSI